MQSGKSDSMSARNLRHLRQRMQQFLRLREGGTVEQHTGRLSGRDALDHSELHHCVDCTLGEPCGRKALLRQQVFETRDLPQRF